MKNRSIAFIALAGLTAAAGLSCASQSAATTPASSSTATPAPETKPQETAPAAQEAVVGPPQVQWKDMTKQQRGKYMAMVVMPKMKEVFQGFDKEKFAKVTCGTCHGPGAQDHSFAMPNPEIFVLPPPEGFAPLMQKEPEWVKFMAEKVKPTMATLLGMKEFDPANPQPGTFSCNNCHTVKEH